MKKISSVMLSVFLLSSCAHKLPNSNYDRSKVNHKNEGIFKGTMKIKYDGSDMEVESSGRARRR